MAATTALEMMGPIPGTLDALVEAPPIAGEVLDDAQHARREHVRARGEDDRQFGAQEANALAHGDAALQHEGTDLVDDAGPLRYEPLAHPMQSLQVELIGRLRRYELHCRALHRFGDRFCIVEVVLLPLRIGPHILCRHQSGIVPKGGELAGEMMRPDASLHADETGRYVSEPRLDLTARPLLTQDDRATAIVADDVERVLADVDADYGDLGAC